MILFIYHSQSENIFVMENRSVVVKCYGWGKDVTLKR